jgi:hypothetical protein
MVLERILHFMLVATLANCGESPTPVESQTTTTETDGPDDTLCEAVVRWFLAQGFEAEHYSTCFVSWDETLSVGPSFFEHFGDTAIQVKAFEADCEHLDNGYGYFWYRDRSTGKRAFAVYIGPVMTESSDHVRVEAAYDVQTLHAAGYELELEQRGSAWTVASSRQTWVS